MFLKVYPIAAAIDKERKENVMEKGEMIFRNAGLSDVNDLVELEKEIWGEDMFAEHDKWAARINKFPEGVRLVIQNGILIGAGVVLRVDWKYPDGYYPTWAEITDNGYIGNHSPAGNVLYGVDISVRPKKEGIAGKILQWSLDMIKECHIARGMLGCRIPSLVQKVPAEQSSRLTPEQVCELALADPSVQFFMGYGFKLVAARKDYFPEDEASYGWGAILENI